MPGGRHVTRLGYARGGTADRDTELLIRDLEAPGCAQIYRDHGSVGPSPAFPSWTRCWTASAG